MAELLSIGSEVFLDKNMEIIVTTPSPFKCNQESSCFDTGVAVVRGKFGASFEECKCQIKEVEDGI